MDSRLDTTKLFESGINVNVERITDANIGKLLSKHLPPSPILEAVDSRTEGWIRNFWRIFTSLNISKKAIIDYPLVQTSQVRRYVALSSCESSLNILANFSDQEWLSQCLTRMGFVTINTVSLPTPLREILEPYPTQLSVDSLLSVLLDHPHHIPISALFDSLDLRLREKFVSWIRSHFHYMKASYFSANKGYRTLPIWKTTNDTFVSADEAVMLPDEIDLESVVPFSPSGKVVNYNFVLKHMGVQPPSSILPLINIPTLIEQQLDEAYQELIRVLL